MITGAIIVAIVFAFIGYAIWTIRPFGYVTYDDFQEYYDAFHKALEEERKAALKKEEIRKREAEIDRLFTESLLSDAKDRKMKWWAAK